MQKFLDNAVRWFLVLVAICFFFSVAVSLIFRGFYFLRYGENPEMPINILVGKYYFDWVGIQKIVDFFLELPIEFGLIAAGFVFIKFADSVDENL